MMIGYTSKETKKEKSLASVRHRPAAVKAVCFKEQYYPFRGKKVVHQDTRLKNER